MLTRLVRTALALELAVAVALGMALHRWAGWSIPGAIAAVVALALAVRVFLVGFTFTVAWLYRSPRDPLHRIGIWRTARMVAAELQALIVGYYLRLPFPRRVLRPDPPPGQGRCTPVMLAHGYLANRGYFAPTIRWLEAHGVETIHAPDFPSVFSTIEAYADELHRQIERVAAGDPGFRLVLACHSMGGLAARAYLRKHGRGRIARLVTMGSPHHGTALAPFGFGPHARQMRRGSEFLASLARSEAQCPPGIPATSIYTVHDNMVAPQETSRLAWATNVPVAGVGHIRMVAHEPVLRRLLEDLRAAGATRN